MIVKNPMNWVLRVALFGGTALSLAACVNGLPTPFGQAQLAAEPEAPVASPSQETVSAGQEIEAPDVFYASETGLWDGRPSLGGVWVAHPDVVDPERVLIRNAANGQTVTGALFRRERDNPGPDLMVSSDAAGAINVIAGQPTDLEIVALRPAPEPEPLNIAVPPPAQTPLEDAASTPETALAEADIAPTTPDLGAEGDSAAAIAAMAASALDAASSETGPTDPEVDPIELAAAVVTRAQTAQTAIPQAALANSRVLAPAPLPASADPFEPLTLEGVTDASSAAIAPSFEVSSLTLETDTAGAAPTARPAADANTDTPSAPDPLDRPFIQVGVFSAQGNAETAADQLRGAGIVPTTLNETGNNGPYWRLTVGPAQNSQERAALLDSVRGLGFEDAYFVAN